MNRLQNQWETVSPMLTGDPAGLRYVKCVRYLVEEPRDATIVDIGCGQGRLLRLIHQLGFRSLLGFDYSFHQTEKARAHFPGGKYFVADSVTLPLKNEAVDIVISSTVIEHVTSPADFVREVWRVLKPHGMAIISTDCYFWRIEQILGAYKSLMPIDRALFPTTLLRMFRRTGFTVVHQDAWGSFLKHLYHIGVPLAVRRWVRSRRRGEATGNCDIVRELDRKPMRVAKFCLLKHVFLDENVFCLRKLV